MSQRIGIWVVRIAIAMGAVVLGLIGVFAFMTTRGYYNWVNCVNDPIPPSDRA